MPNYYVAVHDRVVYSQFPVLNIYIEEDGQLEHEIDFRYGSRQNITVRTATTPASPVTNIGVPFMIFSIRAFPPILLVRSSDDLVWAKRVVLGGMPLYCDVGVERGKRVGYRDLLDCTARAAGVQASAVTNIV